jgi:protein-tyrosine phosphatase
MVSRPEVLVLCTANICRSPMAQALLADRLAALGWAVTVHSGGMLGDGEPPCPQAISVMAGYGLDITAHRSRRLTASDFERADLTLAMTRENLRYAVVEAPAVWPRAFTIKELVRRGEGIGPRPPGESLAGWLARAHDGRERAALLGDSADDDVADPTGGPLRGYTDTATALGALVDRLVRLCWPPAALAALRAGA